MKRLLAAGLLGVIFFTALFASWKRRQPYEKRGEFLLRDAEKYGVRIQDSIVSTSDGRQVKPDELDARPVTVVDAAGRELIELPQVPFAWNARFVDDDSIIFLRFDETDRVEVHLFRRRFPENWWGHLYRVEVWVAIVAGMMLVGIAVRERIVRKKRMA